jgi:preprotein translocase subunit SecA
MVTRAIASAQSQIEARNFEIRKNVLKYDDVLNRQREVIYGERRQVLEGADLHEQIRHFLDDVVRAYVVQATTDGYADDWDLDQLWTALKTLYPVGITVGELLEEAGGAAGVTQDMLVTELTSDAQLAYDRREEALGADTMRELERRVVLSVLDRKWREHLYEMDYLQEGIGLRAMAQRDPLVEYQREGYQLFQAMTEAIKEESVGYLFNLEVEVEQPAEEETQGEGASVLVAKGLVAPQRPARLSYSAPTVDGEGGVETHSEGEGEQSAAPAGRGNGSSGSSNRAARRASRKGRKG